MNEQPSTTSNTSRAAIGGDHDQPHAGYRAYQFSTRERARLLQLRGDLLEARLGRGRWVEDLSAS
jgi:hypothetical protein